MESFIDLYKQIVTSRSPADEFHYIIECLGNSRTHFLQYIKRGKLDKFYEANPSFKWEDRDDFPGLSDLRFSESSSNEFRSEREGMAYVGFNIARRRLLIEAYQQSVLDNTIGPIEEEVEEDEKRFQGGRVQYSRRSCAVILRYLVDFGFFGVNSLYKTAGPPVKAMAKLFGTSPRKTYDDYMDCGKKKEHPGNEVVDQVTEFFSDLGHMQIVEKFKEDFGV